MEEYLIVDGYNMIGAWPRLIKLAEEGLEEARDELISMLADYQGYSGRKIIIVFDAHQVPGSGKKFKQHGLDIRFTKEKETADERIERLVGELSRRTRRIYVATSDMIEQHVIFGRGALRLSARELLLALQETGADLQNKIHGETKKVRNSFSSKIPLELRGEFEKWRRNWK